MSRTEPFTDELRRWANVLSIKPGVDLAVEAQFIIAAADRIDELRGELESIRAIASKATRKRPLP